MSRQLAVLRTSQPARPCCRRDRIGRIDRPARTRRRAARRWSITSRSSIRTAGRPSRSTWIRALWERVPMHKRRRSSRTRSRCGTASATSTMRLSDRSAAFDRLHGRRTTPVSTRNSPTASTRSSSTRTDRSPTRLFGVGAKSSILGFAGSSYFTSGPSAGKYREGQAIINGYIKHLATRR